MSAEVSVFFGCSAEEAFRFLADPTLRPRWQSSLRRVEVRGDPTPRLGQEWVDVTVVPFVRPRLVVTRFEPWRRWAERGTLGPVSAELDLGFVAVRGGTRVAARMRVRGRGLGAIAAAATDRLAPAAVAADLRTAAKLLA